MIKEPEISDQKFFLRRAQTLRAQGRSEQAVIELRRGIGQLPRVAELHHQLGNALKSLGRFAEARGSLQEAARLEPAQAAIWLNLGVTCLEIRLLDEAVDAFRRALTLEPTRPEAHNILGHALLLQGKCTESANELEQALRLRPGYPAAHDNLGRVRKAQGRSAEAIGHHRAALAGQPRAAVHSNVLFSLNFLPGIDPEEILAEHERWSKLYAGTALPAPADELGDRKLRIGYVSPDLVNHAVAYFIEPVLAHHDRENFQIFCYSDALVPDAVTRRLRVHASHWYDSSRWTDDRLNEQIRTDGIDILIDLAGHTARNRLAVFARKPAPVQVTWLGYPNTTGLSAIDYRLTDAISDPLGQTERWHSEKLLRLPETFSCYQAPGDAPPVGTLPAEESGYVTFGCFNNLAKVTPEMIALWAQILKDVSDSRLLLKSRGLSDPATAAHILEQFTRMGIAPERIELNGQELSTAGHLGLYRRIDIALDTSPYNGTTTTCEALWMGVPVVTLAGRTHVARVGVSLLTHLGVPEWVAASPNEYRARARSLAENLPLLAWLRQNLRERMRASPLCLAPRFTRNLEDAFRWMWRRRASRPLAAVMHPSQS